MAAELATRRNRFLESLTPTPDVDLEAVRGELELQLAALCADACPYSQPSDCRIRDVDIVRRDEATLRADFDVACGPYQAPDGSWSYHAPPVPRSASFDRFGGRWLLSGFGGRK